MHLLDRKIGKANDALQGDGADGSVVDLSRLTAAECAEMSVALATARRLRDIAAGRGKGNGNGTARTWWPTPPD